MTVDHVVNPDSITAAPPEDVGSTASPAPDWLLLARQAQSTSQTYFDSSIQKHVVNDIRQANSVHKQGSKYLSPDYTKRSRLFRPKTKTTIRKNEASAAEAFFGSRDVLEITAENDADPLSVAGAKYLKELVQYRLRHSIKWFLIAMGAYQEAQTVGVVCSMQDWVYDPKQKKNQPVVKLIPVENLRVDPACDWTDPINTSPYVIEHVPMYVKDVQAKARPVNGVQAWAAVSDAQLLVASGNARSMDPVRQAREGHRQDPKNQGTITPFTVVWVHRNIIEFNGQDWVFYTLGTEALLSNPVPIEQVWWTGKRPYVMGIMAIEAHRNYPGGVARMTSDLQDEINELANSRVDNVKFVLQKRHLVKRNGRVDIRSLSRNVPGSSTLVDNIETDVKVLDTPDVTASSYKEMDALNVDFDDVAGSFSQSSIVTNKQLNETVGGFQMLDQKANQVGNYQLRTFAETWMVPVLRQLVTIEAHYEDDERIMLMCMGSSGIQDMGVQQITNELMMADVIVEVDVGQGSTDPSSRMAMMTNAFGTIRSNLSDGILEARGLKTREFMDEVFAIAGFKSSERFFDQTVDPALAASQEQVQTLKQQLSQKGDPPDIVQGKLALLAAQTDSAKADALTKNTSAAFAAIQAAGVIAITPAVAPIADQVMKAAGYENPNPTGVSPAYEAGMPGGPLPQPAGPVPGAADPNLPDQPGGVTPNTDPMRPATGDTGEHRGIETPRADSQP